MKNITICEYEVLSELKEKALEWYEDNYNSSASICARLWSDGDITYDYCDGNMCPIENDYITIAKSDTFCSIYDVVSRDVSLVVEEQMEDMYKQSIKDDTCKYNEMRKCLDKGFMTIEDFVEVNDNEWYEEYLEETKEEIIDFYDFASLDIDNTQGEAFVDFCKEHNLNVEFE